jgi:uncharacterized membrane protein YccC
MDPTRLLAIFIGSFIGSALGFWLYYLYIRIRYGSIDAMIDRVFEKERRKTQLYYDQQRGELLRRKN